MTRILQPITSTWLDYPDKEDCSLVVVMMGCDNGCPKCQNPNFKNPDFNTETKEYSVDELIAELKQLSIRHRTNKIVLSGGDPLSCFNVQFTKEFLEKSPFEVCVYTGHNIDYVKMMDVKNFTFVKCGLYDENNAQPSEKMDEYIRFASTNQQLFDSNYCCLSQDGVYYFKN